MQDSIILYIGAAAYFITPLVSSTYTDCHIYGIFTQKDIQFSNTSFSEPQLDEIYQKVF